MRPFFVRAVQRYLTAVVILGSSAVAASAQVTDTPVPFDTSGTVRSISPTLVTRLGLGDPLWPVRGDFIEARLFSVSTGGFVIVAERRDGRRDRYVVSPVEANALRAAVTSTMLQVGRVVGEEGATSISEPASGAFVRNQVFLTAAMYGPALSALTHDAAAGTAAYLLSIGGSYFVVSNFARQRVITKAQSALSRDGALRTTAALLGIEYAIGNDPSPDLTAFTALAGGIGGSIIGYQLGRGLTNSEATSMTFGSNLAALTAVGATGTLGLFDVDTEGRATAGIAVAAGLAGYAVGPLYPRQAGYSVTSGDIGLLSLSGLLGAAVAGIPIAGDGNADTKLVSGLLTAGMLGGVLIGDRAFVRPYDHTESEAGLVSLGGVAGGLMGAAIPVAAQSSEPRFVLATVTGGAILGMLAAEALVNPRRAGDTIRREGASRFRFNPGSLAMAATGRQGIYPVVNFKF